jgi:sporulation protein YlmC with PRC-barrel domain
MLKLKRISNVLGMKVYTDGGDYFGDIEEAELVENRVFGWKIKSTKESYLNKAIGGAKGVIVPHNLVRAIGDIFIISKTAIPTGYEEKEEEMTPIE